MLQRTNWPTDTRYDLAIRLIAYGFFWWGYLSFMAHHSPAGIDWAAYHSQRLFNAIEYLRLNGYFSAYGYSVWTDCTDCDLTSEEWRNRIYLSGSALKFAPYILLNEWGGAGLYKSVGPWLDRTIIFAAGVLTAELIIQCLRPVSNLPKLWVGIVAFALFAVAPWSYKMITAAWMEIYFLFFFLLAIWLFIKDSNRLACLAYFLACVAHYQWGVIIGVVWAAVFVLGRPLGEFKQIQSYLPPYARHGKGMLMLVGLSLLPAVQELITRRIAAGTVMAADGSSLLTRIGITGDDPHNGGILGALQFLGGHRLAFCLKGAGKLLGGSDLTQKIAAHNCILVTVGMALVSIIAIFGLIHLIKKTEAARLTFLPLSVGLLIVASVLQQSMSVHLLGYSYLFSSLFSAGWLGISLWASERLKTSTMTLVTMTPVIVAILLLSIRINQLAGLSH